ncbi:hypothetical protein Dda_1518 [Drechslerella dactyloides]|uniref:Uncharacterized protein n=1 Tax=Drechslerella dactyloides TaxID=74499 RepID=A0AAD6NM25_DREDA|nr:hypothetical protein Dda_1518 [Drechslerella dactyloides]
MNAAIKHAVEQEENRRNLVRQAKKQARKDASKTTIGTKMYEKHAREKQQQGLNYDSPDTSIVYEGTLHCPKCFQDSMMEIPGRTSEGRIAYFSCMEQCAHACKLPVRLLRDKRTAEMWMIENTDPSWDLEPQPGEIPMHIADPDGYLSKVHSLPPGDPYDEQLDTYYIDDDDSRFLEANWSPEQIDDRSTTERIWYAEGGTREDPRKGPSSRRKDSWDSSSVNRYLQQPEDRDISGRSRHSQHPDDRRVDSRNNHSKYRPGPRTRNRDSDSSRSEYWISPRKISSHGDSRNRDRFSERDHTVGISSNSSSRRPESSRPPSRDLFSDRSDDRHYSGRNPYPKQVEKSISSDGSFSTHVPNRRTSNGNPFSNQANWDTPGPSSSSKHRDNVSTSSESGSSRETDWKVSTPRSTLRQIDNASNYGQSSSSRETGWRVPVAGPSSSSNHTTNRRNSNRGSPPKQSSRHFDERRDLGGGAPLERMVNTTDPMTSPNRNTHSNRPEVYDERTRSRTSHLSRVDDVSSNSNRTSHRDQLDSNRSISGRGRFPINVSTVPSNSAQLPYSDKTSDPRSSGRNGPSENLEQNLIFPADASSGRSDSFFRELAFRGGALI